MTFAEKYATVHLLFLRCAERRGTIGEGFGRLRRLALDWAHVRDRVAVLRSLERIRPPVDEQVKQRAQAEVEDWVDRAVESFVDGSSPGLATDWSRFEEADRFAETDALRRRWPDYELMDFHLVRSSHEWMPQPDEALNTEERASVIQFWRVALDIVAARPRADLKRRDHQYPDEDETWVLDNVATALLQLRPDESPEQLWTAIIDLHSEAHDWPDRFLTTMHRRALAAEQVPATYAPLLRGIVLRAFSAVDGERRWPWHEKVWDTLIGIDYWLSDLWSDRHASHVLQAWDVISFWMENVQQEGRRLGQFASWLAKPAAAPIRLRVLPWFVAQLRLGEEGSHHRGDGAEDSLANLLNAAWDHDQSSLRASTEAFAAFRRLLAWLVELHNRSGLELQGRIGGLA
jgi:hypothetical protein